MKYLQDKFYSYSSLILCFYYSNGSGWFRIFGKGLSIKNLNKYSLTFSQRIGKRKYFLLKNWCFSWLS
jgi:hypothetical protein